MKEYNPLDYDNLTRNVVEELMRQAPISLGDLELFNGAGVYALFYSGDLEHYARVVSDDATFPIYVGKAVPPGARKGQIHQGKNKALFGRLAEHKKSIDAVDDLDADDFTCRFLVVTPLWITMAERFLIQHYQPPWNALVDGFGLHDPGSGRSPKRSYWDTLHTGRAAKWSATVVDHKTQAEVLAELETFLAAHALVGDAAED